MNSYLNDLKEYDCELRIDELSIKCFLYADDQAILAPSASRLLLRKRGMKVNINKIKVMVFEKGESTTECDILKEVVTGIRDATTDTHLALGVATALNTVSYDKFHLITYGLTSARSTQYESDRINFPRVRAKLIRGYATYSRRCAVRLRSAVFHCAGSPGGITKCRRLDVDVKMEIDIYMGVA
ncbi:hypothetical protein EVAR_64793_1 [Eumeta japonica]|uniref:Reverse transcriptase domain-containing protein n=1 Tax=Eumeta variegata TaxID=151549 RepID=A0A4C1ZT01_EUMVA|nr:hypothetical protein EVAR_64793_1 [Eumeta japonica]